MKKPQLGAEESPKETFTGQASDEQIQAWKNQYESVLAIKVKNTDGSISICYLKNADRNVASLALTHTNNKKYMEAGGVLIANCWLGGDEKIKTTERLYIGACHQAADALDIAEATSEKL